MAGGRFYVYELLSDDVLLYVGKGSGNRLRNQMKKYTNSVNKQQAPHYYVIND